MIKEVFLTLATVAVITGLILDVAGLWVSVKMAERRHRKRSRFFYCIMRIGEVIENIAFDLFILTAIIYVVSFLQGIIAG